MSVVTDYKILTETNYYALAAIVESYLKEGWQPLGGVAYGQSEVFISGSKRIQPKYIQAIVKYEKPKPNQL